MTTQTGSEWRVALGPVVDDAIEMIVGRWNAVLHMGGPEWLLQLTEYLAAATIAACKIVFLVAKDNDYRVLDFLNQECDGYASRHLERLMPINLKPVEIPSAFARFQTKDGVPYWFVDDPVETWAAGWDGPNLRL